MEHRYTINYYNRFHWTMTASAANATELQNLFVILEQGTKMIKEKQSLITFLQETTTYRKHRQYKKTSETTS